LEQALRGTFRGTYFCRIFESFPSQGTSSAPNKDGIRRLCKNPLCCLRNGTRRNTLTTSLKRILPLPLK